MAKSRGGTLATLSVEVVGDLARYSKDMAQAQASTSKAGKAMAETFTKASKLGIRNVKIAQEAANRDTVVLWAGTGKQSAKMFATTLAGNLVKHRGHILQGMTQAGSGLDVSWGEAGKKSAWAFTKAFTGGMVRFKTLFHPMQALDEALVKGAMAGGGAAGKQVAVTWRGGKAGAGGGGAAGGAGAGGGGGEVALPDYQGPVARAASQIKAAFSAAFTGGVGALARTFEAGAWTKAGRQAADAFTGAFRAAGAKILKTIALFVGASALAALFSQSGNKYAQLFAKGFGGLAAGLKSPIGKAILAASITAIFVGAGVKIAWAFTKAFANTLIGATSQLVKAATKIGVALTRAFVAIGARAARGMAGAMRAVITAAMSPQALIAGLMGGALLAGPILFIKNAVKAASDLNETINKVETTFGEAAKAVIEGADLMAKKFGVPKREFLDAASSLGLIALGAKFSTTEAAKMSVTLARLAADAASFYNVPLEEALVAMRAGLVGESEPLRRFGVLLDEEQVKLEGQAMGFELVAGRLSMANKVAARYSLIVKGMATAEGDLQRTGSELANRMREMAGRWAELTHKIGKYFLPVAKSVTRIMSELTALMSEKLEGYSAVFESWGKSLEAAAEEAGMLFRNLSEVKKLLFTATQDNPYGQAIGMLQEVFTQFVGSLANYLVGWVGFFTRALSDTLELAFDGLRETFTILINEMFRGLGLGNALIPMRKAKTQADIDMAKGENKPPVWQFNIDNARKQFEAFLEAIRNKDKAAAAARKKAEADADEAARKKEIAKRQEDLEKSIARERQEWAIRIFNAEQMRQRGIANALREELRLRQQIWAAQRAALKAELEKLAVRGGAAGGPGPAAGPAGLAGAAGAAAPARRARRGAGEFEKSEDEKKLFAMEQEIVRQKKLPRPARQRDAIDQQEDLAAAERQAAALRAKIRKDKAEAQRVLPPGQRRGRLGQLRGAEPEGGEAGAPLPPGAGQFAGDAQPFFGRGRGANQGQGLPLGQLAVRNRRRAAQAAAAAQAEAAANLPPEQQEQLDQIKERIKELKAKAKVAGPGQKQAAADLKEAEQQQREFVANTKKKKGEGGGFGQTFGLEEFYQHAQSQITGGGEDAATRTAKATEKMAAYLASIDDKGVKIKNPQPADAAP
jgi:hypothetical protein